MKIDGGKRMTVREVADRLGCNTETVRAHIREFWPALMQNGATTYLTEPQVTVILERLKNPGIAGASANLQFEIVGVETSQSRVLRLQILQKQMQEIYEAEIAELKAKAETDRPKVEFYDQVADSGDALQMRDVAAALNLPDWGRNKLFAFLRERNILDSRNIPYREYQDRGYFRVIEQTWDDTDGKPHINLKTLVYQKGVEYIRNLVHQNRKIRER
jgi:phage antirepressor YoqD-like protein